MMLRNKKTGEIIIPTDYTFATYDDGIRYGHHIYYSLAELNEDWEDYKPKESLIKDEKIRKAVRAWAEALNADEVRYNSCAEYSEGRFEAEMGMADIDFGRVIGLKDGNYTIAELCGEDE